MDISITVQDDVSLPVGRNLQGSGQVVAEVQVSLPNSIPKTMDPAQAVEDVIAQTRGCQFEVLGSIKRIAKRAKVTTAVVHRIPITVYDSEAAQHVGTVSRERHLHVSCYIETQINAFKRRIRISIRIKKTIPVVENIARIGGSHRKGVTDSIVPIQPPQGIIRAYRMNKSINIQNK